MLKNNKSAFYSKSIKITLSAFAISFAMMTGMPISAAAATNSGLVSASRTSGVSAVLASRTSGESAALESRTSGVALSLASQTMAASADLSGQDETSATESQTESESETSSNPVNILAKNGWYDKSYYVNDVMVTGWKKIDGSKYYFDKDGIYKTGLVKISGHYYYFNKKGVMQTGWQKVNGEKHYFKKSGMASVGGVRIGTKYYVFNTKGKLMSGGGKRIVTIANGYRYYVDDKGRAITGWYYISDKKKVIYARKNGRLAKNESIDGIAFNSRGYCVITNQGLARIEARKFIKKHTQESWSNTKKFRTCWYYIIGHNNYVGINRPEKYFSKNWIYRVAVDMFTNDLTGDCNGIACATAAVAKELGFKPYVIRTTAHHCFVKAKGKYYDNMYGATFARSSHWSYKVKEKFLF